LKHPFNSDIKEQLTNSILNENTPPISGEYGAVLKETVEKMLKKV
jgi:hypothetical protein